MHDFSISHRLEVVQDLVGYMLGGAWSFLAAVAVLAFIFTVVRSAVMGNTNDPIVWGLRLLVVVATLASYQTIVSTMISASDDLASYFMHRAHWDEFSRHISDQFQPMFADAGTEGEAGVVDRVLGVMRGGLLTGVTALTYYMVFVVFDYLRDLTAVIAALLVVAGPLLVAGGVLGDGKTIKQWFASLIQVALWPVLPPFMMMVIVGTSGFAAESGNTAYIIAQNCVFLFLTLLTPFIIAFLMGRAGVSALATAVIGASVGLVVGAIKTARGAAVAGAGGGAGAAAGVGAGGGATAGSLMNQKAQSSPASSRHKARRPGDDPPDDGDDGAGQQPPPQSHPPQGQRRRLDQRVDPVVEEAPPAIPPNSPNSAPQRLGDGGVQAGDGKPVRRPGD